MTHFLQLAFHSLDIFLWVVILSVLNTRFKKKG
jgi:hypothetical protein